MDSLVSLGTWLLAFGLSPFAFRLSPDRVELTFRSASRAPQTSVIPTGASALLFPPVRRGGRVGGRGAGVPNEGRFALFGVEEWRDLFFARAKPIAAGRFRKEFSKFFPLILKRLNHSIQNKRLSVEAKSMQRNSLRT